MSEPKRASFQTREGHVFSHVDGRLHSENDEPSITYADGTRWWYRDNQVHRDGGPAVIFGNGVVEWWQAGKRHRADGPAMTYPDTDAIAPALRGVRQWWHQGKLVREEVPPRVQRYRQMVAQAHQACFGGAP